MVWWYGNDQHGLVIDYHALGEQTNLVSSGGNLEIFNWQQTHEMGAHKPMKWMTNNLNCG